jgi:hypothetical protein
MSQAEYVLRLLNTSEYKRWDDFVRNASGGSIFHSSTWAGILSQVIQRPFKMLVAQKGDQIKGGILYWPKRSTTVKALTRVPLTPYQGILYSPNIRQKPSSQIAETCEISQLILQKMQNQYHFIDITSNPFAEDMRPYIWQGCRVTPAYTYTFPLQEDSAQADHFSQALRRKIAVSRKKELQVLESDDACQLIDFVFDSYRYHKTKPPLSHKQNRALIDQLINAGMAKLFYLKLRDVCAGLLVLCDEKNVYALMSGIEAGQRTNTFSEYLHSEVMLRPEFRGKRFDFLGANTQAFEQFKRSFGGSLQLYFHIIYIKSGWVKFLQAIRRSHHQFKRQVLC